MRRRTLIAAPLVALAMAGSLPATAAAAPVPLATCTGGQAAPAMPCLPAEDGGGDPLASVARSGAEALWRFWSTAALELF